MLYKVNAVQSKKSQLSGVSLKTGSLCVFNFKMHVFVSMDKDTQ